MDIMRYLAIDYGEKRVGVAVSDEQGKIAFPKCVLANKGAHALIRVLRSILKKEAVIRIILGMPAFFDGKETEQTRKTRRFGALLAQRTGHEVVYENEALTTRILKDFPYSRRSAPKDDISATFILQSYLDKKNKDLYIK